MGEELVAKTAVEMQMAFGERLRACRELRGYKTQKAIAERLGIDPKRYWKWEIGKVSPQSLAELEKLIDLLVVTSDYLQFGRTNGLTREAYDLFVRDSGDESIEDTDRV